MEQEHSRAIIVFERAKKRRQHQFLRDEAVTADAIQREAAKRQHIAEHYSLRSSPIAAITFETSNFFQASTVSLLSNFGVGLDITEPILGVSLLLQQQLLSLFYQ